MQVTYQLKYSANAFASHGVVCVWEKQAYTRDNYTKMSCY